LSNLVFGGIIIDKVGGEKMYFLKGALFNWAFLGGPDFYIRKLSSLAAKLPQEKWSYGKNTDYGILQNYLNFTFQKLQDERDKALEEDRQSFIYIGDDSACFNTGLFDNYWQPIYFYCVKNTRPGYQAWIFKEFSTNYELTGTGIPTALVSNLRRANYFDDPSALIFNVNLPIIPQWDHILDDEENYNRIPEHIRKEGKQFCHDKIEIAITRVKDRIAANYKTVVPQYYWDRNNNQGRIQLLAPLYLTGSIKPELALVLSLAPDKSAYLGHTCLTTEWAYNNARLIARPDSDWLQP